MPFAPSKPWGTLRFRLSAWNTLVVLVAVLSALVAVRESVRVALVGEVDHLLEDDTLELALAVKSLYPDRSAIQRAMQRKAQGHADRQLFAQYLDAQGQVAWSSEGTPKDFLRRTRPMSPRSNLIRHLSGSGYLAVERLLEDQNFPPMTIRVGCWDAHVHSGLARLTAAMVLVGLGVLVAAPIGGYWLAGRATRPLAEINRTASRLQPARLDERLPVRGTGDELDHLSKTINGLLDRLAAYVGRNQDILANAAHELRSPLAAIQSSAEVALAGRRSPAEYEELLAEIVDGCGHLRGLVNQLLLLAETDAGVWHAELERLGFDEVVFRAVEMFQGVAEDQGVSLRCDDLPRTPIRGDAKRLRQVVNNLIDNAIKFTPEGGTVQVGLTRDTPPGLAMLTVSDTGAGISPQDLPRVFERFFRSDESRERRFRGKGTGLGLPICKALVEGHGGTIEISSTPARGTTVTVRLPLAEGEEEASAGTSA